jgi:hypothetical protein
MIEKHRNGPVGSAELYFDGQHVRFLNIDSRHQQNGGGASSDDDF